MDNFHISAEIMGYHCSANYSNGEYQLSLPEWSGRQTDVAQIDHLIRFLQAFKSAITGDIDVPMPPAADVPAGKERLITSVEKFISRSGNESWKAESDDVVIYFRQVQKEMLKEAGLWDDLNDMEIGEVCAASIVLYTVPDGDLHKIVSIDPGGAIFFDDDDDPDDEANQEPIYDPAPDGTAAAMMAFDFSEDGGIALAPEIPDEHFTALDDNEVAEMWDDDDDADED